MSAVVVNPCDAQDEREAAALDTTERARALGNEPALPAHDFKAIGETSLCRSNGGLTKREYLAGLAMQALAAPYQQNSFTFAPNPDHVAKMAVARADALLLELSR